MKNLKNPILASLFVLFILPKFETRAQKREDVPITSKEKIAYPAFDQFFDQLGNFSGNVLVAVHGKPIFKRSYGYANIELKVRNTSETKFRIGSVTKQFTAMAIMILLEQGKLSVSDKISDYIPDVPDIWKEITIHQLLTHTSGIMHSWELEGFRKNMMLYTPVEEIINHFKDQPLVGYPGEKFHYSGTGYFILSSIIKKVSGRSYDTFLREEIFDKAGMTDTGSDDPVSIIPNRASGYITDSTGTHNSTFIYMPILTGGGNLYSTTDDLLKWDQALNNNLLISKESKERMFSTELNHYAYGWFVFKSDSLYRTVHSGGVPGFVALIDRYPDMGILIVILANNSNPGDFRGFPKLVLEEWEKTNSIN